ncbi:MAG: DUF1292 domain-containing protein [Clostridiales bacterium]|nr:DUF1292 domain-containing protein [Clostridiales bacterium]
MEENIIFTTEDGEKIGFKLVEEFKLNGASYLLVEDTKASEDEDNAYILKVVKNDNDEMIYEMVYDDNELSIISDYLNDILDDIYIE